MNIKFIGINDNCVKWYEISDYNATGNIIVGLTDDGRLLDDHGILYADDDLNAIKMIENLNE